MSRAGSLCMLGLVLAAPAYPQQRDTLRADTTRLTLPPLTVTAAREERSLLDVPLAITRVAVDERVGAAGQGLDVALAFVPGVTAQSRAGWTDIRLSIRGYGARGAGDRSNAGTARGIRVLLDGVPETEPDGRTAFDNVDLAAVRGIEVVRSNASALWGNAAGGVVSLTTLPADGRECADVEATAGGYGLRRLAASGTSPLGDGVLAISLVRGTWGGWRDHSDADRWLATASARTGLGGRSRLGAFLVASDNFYRIPGPLSSAQADSAPQMANPTYAARDERRHHRVARMAASLERQFGRGASVSSLVFVSPKFLQRSERGTFRDFTRYHVGGDVVVHLERSLGRGLAATLLAGADEALQDGAILFYSLTPQGTRGDTLRSDKKEGANNAGLFLQAELDVGDRLAVVAGARYDAIRYDFRDYLDPRLDASRTFSRVTPKLGVRWSPSPLRAFYANLGGGVEAPAANEVDPPGTFGQDTVTAIHPLLEPIRSTTFEVGTKHVVAGGRWLRSIAYDVALYTTAVANEIVPYRGGRFYFTAGRVRRSGLEVGLSLRGPAGLSLEHALTLSRNRYVEYVVDSVHYGRPGAVADYAGNAVVGVPAAVYAVAVAYTRSGGTPVTARFSVQGSSGYYVDDANTVRVPAYGIASLTVGVEQPVRIGRELAVRGYVTVANLLDRRFIGSAYLNPDVVGGVPLAFEPGLPRQLIVSLALRRSAP